MFVLNGKIAYCSVCGVFFIIIELTAFESVKKQQQQKLKKIILI